MTPLTGAQINTLDRGLCPYCHHRGFVLGPRGGFSTNIECGNIKCRARFNVAQFSTSHRIIDAHTIEKQIDGGADWGNGPAQ